MTASIQDVTWHIDYQVHLGETWGRFMEGLAAREIRATSCDRCTRTFVPPQAFCETCMEPASSWSTLPGTGTLTSFTISYHAFEGGPPAPYALGAFVLDGADTMLIHFLAGDDLDDIEAARERYAPGTRVQVVWADETRGHILDIRHFAPVAGS